MTRAPHPALVAAQRLMERAYEQGKVRTVSRDMGAMQQRTNHWTRIGDAARAHVMKPLPPGERGGQNARAVRFAGKVYASVRKLASKQHVSHTTIYNWIEEGKVSYV